jgi:hypothetical protein
LQESPGSGGPMTLSARSHGSILLRSGLALLLAFSTFSAERLGAQQVLTKQETAGIQKDTERHFGDAPADPGSKATVPWRPHDNLQCFSP